MNTVTTAPLPFVQNLAIMASAGTGKTYQLAMRFIALLLAGAKPEEIAALTFSRKAAGEILEKIVSLLSEMIRQEKTRNEAAEDGFIPPGTTAEQLSRVLRDTLACRRKLHIETNDSFLFQIVQTAPAEFGIRGEIGMIDENDDRPRQRALLRTLHTPLFAGTDPDSRFRRNAVYQVLRDISFGKNKPTLYAEITELLKNHYRAFLNFPEPDRWSLPDDAPAAEDRLSAGQIEELRQRFEELLEESVSEGLIRPNAQKRLLDLAELVKKVPADHFTWPDLQNTASLISFYEGIRNKDRKFRELPAETDAAVWTYYRNDNTLSGPILQILCKWVRHLAALVYDSLSSKTRAVYTIMNLFDDSFSAQTRAAGKITFADILYLINSKQTSDYGTLQVLQERLGTTVGHYLLDEFQDTSTAQWKAFKDLAEEAIQNCDPGRFTSFFMVGDIKQSIYQWREGNPALFQAICDEYGFHDERSGSGPEVSPAGPGGIRKSLACSFRSSTPVLQLVNDVFAPEKQPSFPQRLNDQALVFLKQVGKMQFERHKSGLKAKDHPENGCSLVLTTQPCDDDEQIALRLWQTVYALIKKLDPFSPKREKPLSIAVLFRKNDEIRECYAALKNFDPDLSISMEGSIILKNSMAYAVFRQLLILAAHPGDTAASAYLSMIRAADGTGGLDAIRDRLFPGEEKCDLPRRIREELDQAGAGAFLQRFRAAFPETERESEYMDCLAAALAAGEAEGANALSPDERIALLDKYEEPRKSLARTVQLMTIHKSKGLGFDIVIVPFREKTQHSRGGIVKDEKNGSCYFAPNKDFLPLFPAMKENAESRLAESIYENACNIYVALTRAKRSTIVILPAEKPGTEAATLMPSDILRRTGEIEHTIASEEDTKRFLEDLGPSFDDGTAPLTPVYCAGNPFWAEQTFIPEEKTEKEAPKADELEKSFRAGLAARTAAQPRHLAVFSRHPDSGVSETAPPSSHSFTQHPEFRFQAGTAADFGTRVHEILRDLEWLGTDEEIRQFLRRLSDADSEAFRLLENALSRPGIADRLRHPDSEHVRLFREQPFLLQTGENEPPVSGIIDRATVEYDESGTPLRAEIIDYKTDSEDDPAEFRSRYRRQLEIYRRAMSELTGLPETEIACTILALRPGLAISL